MDYVFGSSATFVTYHVLMCLAIPAISLRAYVIIMSQGGNELCKSSWSINSVQTAREHIARTLSFLRI